MNEEVTKLKGNKYLSTKAIVHENKKLSKILTENEIDELNANNLFVNIYKNN